LLFVIDANQLCSNYNNSSTEVVYQRKLIKHYETLQLRLLHEGLQFRN